MHRFYISLMLLMIGLYQASNQGEFEKIYFKYKKVFKTLSNLKLNPNYYYLSIW